MSGWRRAENRTGAPRGLGGPVSAALALALLTVGAPLSQQTDASGAQQLSVAAPPNVVLILTDDMRKDDLAWMPYTRRRLGQLRVNRFLSNHPLCCPARAELITGQYGHHNGVLHNTGPFGGDKALLGKDNTLAAWLFDAGYKTGFAGKWLNGWAPREGSVRPYGWTRFNAWIGDVYAPYDYTSYNDGNRVRPGEYTNDAVTRSAVRQIREFGDGPFFVFASYIAPHGMFVNGRWGAPVPAPRHADLFGRVIPPYQSKPSFDHGPERTRVLRRDWRQRIRSLQSVDEGVGRLLGALRETGELGDTVLVFTSDNGMLLGEHRAYGKNRPWEEALRVPFLARGPGIPQGRTEKGAMLIDFAPSVARITGVTPGRAVDGRSDLFSLRGGWSNVLIQAGSGNFRKHFSWRGTRTSRWTYVHRVGGRKQLYDRAKDPYQLRNLAGRRPRVESTLARLTPNPY